MLLVPYWWRITLVHVIQRLFRFGERVVETDEVGDGIVVVGDEQPAQDGLGARDERLVVRGGQWQRARRGAPARAAGVALSSACRHPD